MTFTFFLEIFPHTCYGVSDVASVLLFMVQLEKLYSMHTLQCCITGTWLNPMTSKFTENKCWCYLFLPLIKIIYNHQNLFKKVWTGWRFQKFVKNQLNMDKLCFVRLLRLILANSKDSSFNHTISSTLSLSTALCYLKIYLKPSPYTTISVVYRWTLNHPSHYWIKPIYWIDMTLP